MKSKIFVVLAFATPIALVAYFAITVSHLNDSLVPLTGTLSTFETRGSHSSYRKIVEVDEYPARFVRHYEGANMLMVKNFRDVIYEPPQPGEIPDIYYLHPKLKPKEQRQVTLYIRQADTGKLRQNTAELVYLNLQTKTSHPSVIRYYTDLYLYNYQYNNGTLTLFISLLLFLGCCIAGAAWFEQHKAGLVYPITVIILFILAFLF